MQALDQFLVLLLLLLRLNLLLELLEELYCHCQSHLHFCIRQQQAHTSSSRGEAIGSFRFHAQSLSDVDSLCFRQSSNPVCKRTVRPSSIAIGQLSESLKWSPDLSTVACASCFDIVTAVLCSVLLQLHISSFHVLQIPKKTHAFFCYTNASARASCDTLLRKSTCTRSMVLSSSDFRRASGHLGSSVY